MSAKCRGKTKEGKPCSATPRPGSPWCAWHSPELAGKRAEWSRKGGENSSHENRAKKALAGGFRDVEIAQATMLQVLAKLYKGEMDPAVATAMATVARSIDALAKTTGAAGLEEQLAEMRAQIAVLSERRGA
jgi:hypothetical protein